MDDKATTAISDLLALGAQEHAAAPAQARPCYLILVRGGTPGAMVRLLEGANRVGRSGENTWQFNEPGVSRCHAVVHADDVAAWLTDLSSTNGTYVNGRRLPEQTPTPLQDGDRIQFGNSVVLKFVRPDPCEERFHREMFERTVRDPLTGLYNRAYFLEHAAALAGRLAGQGLGMAVILLDIDHFKRVNDTYGHDAGDAVLREVALVLRRSTRQEDLVARYGGEEFAASLPAGSLEQAIHRAERIRKTLAAREIVAANARLRVTASLGLAFAQTGGNRPVPSLLTEADRCLYEAKRAGRNRVVADLDLPPTAADFPAVPVTPIEQRI